MNLQEIEDELAAAIAGADVQLSADGNKLSARIVSDAFAGLSRVKRQQLVYRVLNARIESGEIHAVSMQTLLPGDA